MCNTLYGGNTMTKNTTKSNFGGRKSFKRGSEVRILTVDGKVSKTVFRVDPLDEDHPDYSEYVKSDRKGLVLLRGNNASIQVLFRRILPVSIEGQAPVIDSSGKHFTICPKCSDVFEVIDPQEANCNTCNEIFQLYWLGTKPMSQPMSQSNPETPVADATDAIEVTTEPVVATEAVVKPEAEPTAEKAVKAVKTPAANQREVRTLCLKSLANQPGCDLWTKNGVKFDHANVDVKSHALIIGGSNPRKYCFNTYDGSLGKKAKDLMVAEFLENKFEVSEESDSKPPWHYIKGNFEKHLEDLTKKGYTKN